MNDQNNKENRQQEQSADYEQDMNPKVEMLDEDTQQLEHYLASEVTKELSDQPSTKKNKKKKHWFSRIPLWLRIVFLILILIPIILGIYLGVALGRVSTKFDETQYGEQFEEDENSIYEEMNPEDIEWSNQQDLVRKEENVVNILLVGEEAIGSNGGRGRTDSIMIATMNVDQKALRLTSIMRDTYVQIPGYSDNKINAAYANGGIPLLVDTIEQNFKIKLDGSVLVNFDSFEQLIDKLGGVEITLTRSEAYYLNHNNYISNKAYRNVKEGTQVLNGNQALGYCRVRYVRAANEESNDFGRTSRQRAVLEAIFEKYKSKNAAELILLMNDLIPLVSTDVEKADIINYLYTLVTLGQPKLETLRIPVDKQYDGQTIRKMSVLVPHMPQNVTALHNFIFGEDNPLEPETTNNLNSDSTSENTVEN